MAMPTSRRVSTEDASTAMNRGGVAEITDDGEIIWFHLGNGYEALLLCESDGMDRHWVLWTDTDLRDELEDR